MSPSLKWAIRNTVVLFVGERCPRGSRSFSMPIFRIGATRKGAKESLQGLSLQAVKGRSSAWWRCTGKALAFCCLFHLLGKMLTFVQPGNECSIGVLELVPPRLVHPGRGGFHFRLRLNHKKPLPSRRLACQGRIPPVWNWLRLWPCNPALCKAW